MGKMYSLLYQIPISNVKEYHITIVLFKILIIYHKID